MSDKSIRELETQVEHLNREVSRLRAVDAVRRSAEEALARSELFSQALLKSLPAQVAVVDRHGDIVGTNNAWQRLAADRGMMSLAMGTVGQNYVSLCRERTGPLASEAERLAEGLEQVLCSAIPNFDLNYTDSAPQNRRWWLMRAVPLAHAAGGMVIAQFDVTRQMQTEEALRYISMSVHCLLWYATVEDRGGTLHWERQVSDEGAARRFLPVAERSEAPYAIGLMESILSEDRERVVKTADFEVRAGRSYRQEFRCRRTDGDIRWLAEEAQVETLGHGQWRVVGVCTDITESRRLEQQLLQSQKMDIIGRLASGLAHDFNNSLTAIMGFSGLAELELPFGHPATSYMQNIQQAATRAAELMQQLLAFARRQSIEPKVVDLNGLLVEIDTVLGHLLGARVEKSVLPKPGLGKVNVDPVQMKRVIIDLADYAGHHMEGAGKLVIETTNVTLDNDYARAHIAVLPGEYVQLCLSFTGRGLPEEVRSHLFEPFYTGTDSGEATGLGLAACYGIVKQSGGYIWVYSEAGIATTFKIYLPRVDDGDEDSRVRTLEALARGTETVLIVDDEPLVRSIAIKILRTLGYQVMEATNGREAMRIAGNYSGRIDLLLTDLVMPIMGGVELAKRIMEDRPTVRVLYMSGYSDTIVSVANLLNAGAHFLQKPFSNASLVAKVRSVLDANRA